MAALDIINLNKRRKDPFFIEGQAQKKKCNSVVEGTWMEMEGTLMGKDILGRVEIKKRDTLKEKDADR